ncbi:MAG: type II toxin-antitoxin system VapC family toxin [Thermoanaerobaculia bacterium]
MPTRLGRPVRKSLAPLRNFTAYDAAYVALAEALAAPFMTGDRRLAAAAGQLVDVELV